MPKVIYEKRGKIAYITLNRPEPIFETTAMEKTTCMHHKLMQKGKSSHEKVYLLTIGGLAPISS
jgi:hypothetical protein